MNKFTNYVFILIIFSQNGKWALFGFYLFLLIFAYFSESSSLRPWGLTIPLRSKVTPNPLLSGKSINPSLGKGSSGNKPPKYGAIESD